MNSEFVAMIKAECALQNVNDTDLFCAIVNQESAWNPNAVRYENNFMYFWEPNKHAALEKISIETETILQKISFGLCQVMGANLRWLGYDKPLMTSLDPKTNIELGVQFFKKRCDIYKEIKDKISSYNSGKPKKREGGTYINQGYVDSVYAFYQGLKKPVSK